MTTVHLTTGLPGSGKSTHARRMVADSGGRLRRVNMDDIRAMLDDHGDGRTWSHEHEKTALAIQDASVLAAVRDGFNVVVDNTHLTSNMPRRIRSALAGHQVTYVVHDFTHVPLEECLARDAARTAPVGEKVIRRLHSRLASARRSGWRLTPDWMAASRLTVEPYTPLAGKPTAVLCDIDGTLALNVSRGPYDFDRCGEDSLNNAVDDALYLYRAAGNHIVLMSGRGEEYRPQTQAWLAAHRVPYDELWMRPAGDTRRDDVVKLELFNAHVRARFHVLVSLDDRDRVVALWRGLGIPTFQVNYGAF